MTPQELCEHLESMDTYRVARVLEDGSVAALGDLLFTTAIYLGCDEVGWSKRYCYDDDFIATVEFQKLTSASDRPRGWIAMRPHERMMPR